MIPTLFYNMFAKSVALGTLGMAPHLLTSSGSQVSICTFSRRRGTKCHLSTSRRQKGSYHDVRKCSISGVRGLVRHAHP